jgi:hypothetical protein
VTKCPDCGAPVGERHRGSCDIEPCPRCGRQSISCDCIYEVCGIDPSSMEQEHPDIFTNGPTDEMCEQWNREWGHRSIPWSGEYPGKAECRQYGLYAKFVVGKGWQRCDRNDADATEDLNTLLVKGHWDVDTQKWVISS